MRLGAAMLGVLLGGAIVVAEPQHKGQAAGGRYFNYNSKTAGYNNQKINTGSGYSNQQSNTGSGGMANFYDNAGDLNSLSSQYSGLTNQPQYYDNYASSDYIQDNYISEPSKSSTSASQNPDSSPALSALALLGFLYFLNLIQDVLEDNSGRSVRSVDGQEEEFSFDSASFEEAVEYNIKNNVNEEVLRQPRARKLSFLEEFFINLPRMLGLQRLIPNRRDGRVEKPSEGMASFITTRISLISSIMNFLSDPSPTRVRRSLEPFRGMLNALFSSEDSEEHLGREKRFTNSMNVWYGGMEGQSAQPLKGAKGMIKKVTSLLGGGSTLQEVAASDALPAFKEVMAAMDGGHPHCLQRALCRLNTHSKELPIMSRLALQLLSNNLAEISVDPHQTKSNQEAIISGRRGEDCLKTYQNCNN